MRLFITKYGILNKTRVTMCGRAILKLLMAAMLVKKFPDYYETRKLITVFTTACHHFTLLPQRQYYIPSTPRCSKQSFSFGYSEQNFVCMSSLRVCYMSQPIPPLLILSCELFSGLLLLPAQCDPTSGTLSLCSAPNLTIRFHIERQRAEI